MLSMLCRRQAAIESTQIFKMKATAEQVWKVFGDFKHCGRWNKFVMFKAEPKVHERCRIGFLHKDGRKSSNFNQEVRGHSRHWL